jgi:hypothetical protein
MSLFCKQGLRVLKIKGDKNMKSLLQRIKDCQTSKELDLLRIEIVRDTENFQENQRAFIRQKNKLGRNGHTSFTEGYSMLELVREQKAKLEEKQL